MRPTRRPGPLGRTAPHRGRARAWIRTVERGKTFQRTAPADFTDCEFTSQVRFRGREYDDPDGLGWSFYEPGEIETLRVLDVNGTIIIINTRHKVDDQAANAAAELAAVLDSIRIEQA